MDKSVTEMTKKENKLEVAQGVGMYAKYTGSATGPAVGVTLGKNNEIEWGPKVFDALCEEIQRFELEENQLQLTSDTIKTAIVGAFANFVQFAYPIFTKNGYTWKKGAKSDDLENAAQSFIAWKWKNKDSIADFLASRKKQIESLAKNNSINDNFAKEIYVTLFFVESWLKDKAPPKLVTGSQPGQIIVPDAFRAVLTDYQFFNKLLHGNEYEDIKADKTEKRDGEKLKGFRLITHRDGMPLLYRDKLILFAIKSIADRNKVIDRGKEVPAFTVSDVVQQLQPKKTRATAYNPESELYKEVAASIERLRKTEVAIFSKDFAQNRRLEDMPEGGVIAQKAPLIIAAPALWNRRGSIVEGYLWSESEPIKMLFSDFDSRFSVQVAREIIPNNLNKEKLELFAYLLECACSNLPSKNNVDIYADGDENKKALLQKLGWLDLTLIHRPKDKKEHKKDQTQREQIDSMLDAFAGAEVVITETDTSRRVMHFEVTKKLSKTRRKLIGFRIKAVYKTINLIEPNKEQEKTEG